MPTCRPQTPLSSGHSEFAPSTPATSPPQDNEHTPYSKTEDSSGQFSVRSQEFDELRYRLAIEASRTVLGPMPVQDFLDTFLPRPTNPVTPMLPPEGAFQKLPASPTKEHHLYEPMVSGIEQQGKICSSYITSGQSFERSANQIQVFCHSQFRRVVGQLSAWFEQTEAGPYHV